MSAETDNRSRLVRFLDGFLQERNIKWMLGLGMLILFCSSLTLVRTHWEEMPLAWKHLVLLGYTGVIAALGHWTYHRLALRTTGTVLYALTVLLIPLTFVAWSLMWQNTLGATPWFLSVGLLALNAAGGAAIAHFVFRHLLRSTQPTFLACYLLLSLAGAIVPSLPVGWWPAIGLMLWGLFAIGTVKINRHVFWLAEEHRLPRIFGFFPIGLLGTQFLLLTGFYLVPFVLDNPQDREWLGLACVLTAVPVLLTSDTIAHVFAQRTGNLVRPLPWSIVLPLFVGLALSVVGLGVSAMGLPFPRALVPSGALFALMMCVAARRTGKQVFVWAMLVGLTLPYNFSYAFFRDVARQVIHSGAIAVHEQRLPYAFYGLTYLPLLVLLTSAGRWLSQRGSTFFAAPIQRFAVGLTCLLQVVAFTHIKAMFPVSLALTGLLVAQAVCFRNRLLLLPALGSLLAATFGFAPFVELVLMWHAPADLFLICPAALAALLLVFGRRLDTLAARIPLLEPSQDADGIASRLASVSKPLWYPIPGLCLHASLWLTLFVAAAWCLQAVSHWTHDWTAQARVSECLVIGLLVAQALVWRRPWLGAVSWGFVAVAAVMYLPHAGYPVLWICVYSAPALAMLWCLSYLLTAYRIPRISDAYGWGTALFSGIGLSLLLVTFLPLDLTIGTFSASSWHGWFPPVVSHSALWISRVVIAAWAFDAARRFGKGAYGLLGTCALLGLASTALTELLEFNASRDWLPLAWTVTASAVTTVLLLAARNRHTRGDVSLVERDQSLEALAAPLRWFLPSVFLFVSVLSLVRPIGPVQLAGGLASLSLLWLALRTERPWAIRWAAILLNLECILALVVWRAPGATIQTILDLGPPGFLNRLFVLLLAGLCAVSAQLWWDWLGRQAAASVEEGPSTLWSRSLRDGNLLRIFTMSLTAASVYFLLVSLRYVYLPRSFELPLHEVLGLLAAYAVPVAAQIRRACREKSEGRVWLSQALLGALAVHLVVLGVINLTMGLSVYVLMGVGFALWTIGNSVRGHARFSVLTGPFTTTGYVLPLAAVAWATARHFILPRPAGIPADTAALLLPAAFYFWRGIEERSKLLTVLSVGIFNLTLALLWHDLDWRDPQLYMIPAGLSILALVEILSAEIPAQFQSPLRYVGVLCILVSPTFDIVHGSWLHITTLMVAAVVVALLGIGLKVRPFLYCGSAFLVADLAAMVIHGALHDRSVLWIAGIALGTAVLLLGAFFEKRREVLLQRLRILSAQLESWK